MKRYLLLTYLRLSLLVITSVFFIAYTTSAQQKAINLSGFNFDVVAESGLNQTNPALITTYPLNVPPGDVLFEQGYSNNATPYTNGLPVNGQISSPSGHNFQLAAYNTDNVLRLGQTDYGTLIFPVADRISYDSLFILAASIDGASTVSYSVLYTDVSSVSGTLAVSDWTCVGCTDYAINNLSKIDRTTGNVNGPSQYAMREYGIRLSATRQVYGVLLSVNTGGSSVANVFAVTGLPSVPLPVSLVYYDAKVKDGNALLQWKTAQESNNKTYIIERANAAFPDIFVQVGTVPATSSANGSVYNFTNTPNVSGTYLYKLSQVDVDGKKKALGIRSVTINSRTNWIVQDLGSQWRLTSAGPVTYRLIDMNGRVLKAGSGSAGTTTISKPSASGIYFIQVFNNGEWLTQKVIR